MAAPEPLHRARLNAVIRLPFTAYEIAAFRDPRRRDDPKVQRQISADHINSTWSGEVPDATPAVLVEKPNPCWAAAVLVAAEMSAALDLRHVVDPGGEPPEVQICRIAFSDGAVAMPMIDGSVLIFDPTNVEFSAWSDSSTATKALRANGAAGAARVLNG